MIDVYITYYSCLVKEWMTVAGFSLLAVNWNNVSKTTILSII